MWIIATNQISDPIIAIMGQRVDSNPGSAESNNAWGDINLTNLPLNEFKPLYRLIFTCDSDFTNTPKCALYSVLDLRTTVISSIVGTPQNDHGSLFGLADDDHSQYIHIDNARTISAVHTFSNGITFDGSGTQTVPYVPSQVNITGGSGNFASLKLNSTTVSTSGHTHTSSDISNFNTSVSGLISGIYAPLSSPTLTGVPLAPTAASGTNTNQIASTSFVRTEISNLVASAPSALDTLNELASALGNDANFSTTVTNSLASKAALSGATFTGSISSPSGDFTSLKVSGINVSTSGHTHIISDVSGLQAALDGKQSSGSYAALSHNHSISDVTGLQTALDGKQPSGSYASLTHQHNISDVSGLQTTLDGKQPSGSYALSSHTHTSSSITDFNSSVSGLLPVKNITAGSYIGVSSTTGNFTITATGLQPSGNYASSTHTHTSSNITDFNSSVSGLVNGIYAPLSGASFTGSISSPSGNFTSSLQVNGTGVSISGHTHTSSQISDSTTAGRTLLTGADASAQRTSLGLGSIVTLSSGTYALVSHTHTSSDISNFNSSVSGLLPVTNIIAGTNTTVTSSSGIYTINSTASGTSGSSSTSVRGNITTTGTLSSFNVSGGYSIGYLDLFQNGVKLLSGSDFIATDGTSVSLSNSVPSGTVLEYISLGASITSNNYVKLDNISSSFNGSSTSFGLSVSGTPYYPVSANTLGIYVGGVAQEPISSYSVSGSNIIFTEAPASGLTFWGVGYGTTAVATLNGIVPGSSGSPAISSSNDLTTGFYFPSSGNISVVGNLGIGTSVPSSKLQVVGSITANSGNFSNSLQLGGINVSVSGHSHSTSDITNFNSSVSGLLPITNIIAGNGINVAISGTTAIITNVGLKLGTIMALS